MNIIDVSKTYPLVNFFMVTLRDINLQKDKNKFRNALGNIGSILMLEFSKSLTFDKCHVKTPFSQCELLEPQNNISMVAIARAGIPLLESAASLLMPQSIACCSCEKDSFGVRHPILDKKIDLYHKILIIAEPLMTSASSVLCCLKELLADQQPEKIIIFNIIVTDQAINNLESFEKETAIKISLYTCAKDEFMPGIRGTKPGLGDVGDLLYGPKN